MPHDELPSLSQTPHVQIPYERELNEQQLAGVTAAPGPALVIAGAGSGKTRTLIYRVAYLLEQGFAPDRILLLTFTNKAAAVMMERVAELLGQQLPGLWGGTFHSIGNRILRRHAPLLGYARDFTILDREDARHMIRTCLDEAGIDTSEPNFPKAAVLAEIFSLATNTHQTVAQVVQAEYPDFKEQSVRVTDVQQQYTAHKLAANAVDYDDLLTLWLRLLQEHQETREQYQRRFQYILVDEYQDTNKLQSDLIDILAAEHHNVMVVGDDAQSIYGWRGANYQNILRFPDRYPETARYTIEINYRSTPEILQVANAAIAANVHQFPKQLTAVRRSENKPALVVCRDARQQAEFVAGHALHLRDEGLSLSSMAVLYRSHFQALELQLELTRRNIPFSLASGVRFYEQAHIKDVAAYLRLALNGRDEIAFKRLVELLPGIGPKAADKLWQAFAQQAVNGRSDPENRSPVADALESCAGGVPKKAAGAWPDFVATISQLETKEDQRGNRAKPAAMIRHVLEAGYEDYLKANYDNSRSRLEDLEQMANYSSRFESTEDFLTELALITNLEAEEEPAVREFDEQIRLSTIHQAKGLEFDAVFIIMLCQGLFPTQQSLRTADGLEEERRLLYVAITRARHHLFLSYPLLRTGFGEDRQEHSQFLNEIPKELLEHCDLTTYGRRQ